MLLFDPDKFRAGDPVTTRFFIQLARRWVRRYFHKRSQVDAVTQDSLVEMMTKLEAGDRPDPDRVPQWICTCAHNAVRRELTRVRHLDTVDFASELHGNNPIKLSEQVRHVEDLRRVREALEECTEHVRQIFVMRLLGHSHAEIAAFAESKAGAVRMAYSRVIRQLNEQLHDPGLLNISTHQQRSHDDSSSPSA